MALDELIRKIDKETQDSVAEITGSAKKEAERIVDEARAKAAAIAAESKKDALEKAASRRREHESETGMEFDRIVQDAMSEAIEREETEIAILAKKELEASRNKIITDAVKRFSDVVPKETMVATASGQDKAILEKLDVNVKAGRTPGIILSSQDGSIRADLSLDKMLLRQQEMIRSLIAKELFEGYMNK